MKLLTDLLSVALCGFFFVLILAMAFTPDGVDFFHFWSSEYVER